MSEMIPADLRKLVRLSSSWRKTLFIIAIPALIVGGVFAADKRIAAAAISFAVCALFSFLALKPKNPRKSKIVQLLIERPAEVVRVSVIQQSALGAKSAQVHRFTDQEGAQGILLIDDVRKLDEALSIIGRHAPQARVEREEMRIKLG